MILADLARDIRHALRLLGRRPGGERLTGNLFDSLAKFVEEPETWREAIRRKPPRRR